MILSVDIKPSKVVLLGMGSFPKDKELQSSPLAQENLSLMQSVFADPKIFGLPDYDQSVMLDVADHTAIKEKIALAGEQAKGILYFYYTGQIVLRKGRLYLATPSSTLALAHVNALSLDELIEIVRESSAKEKVFIFDAKYHKTSSDFNFDTDQLLSEIFSNYETEFPNTIFISNSSNADLSNTFTKNLITVLSKGIDDERDGLTFSDIFELVKNTSESNQTPIKAAGKIKRNPIIAPNRRFIDFMLLKKDADAKFESENFSEALTIYEQMLSLFPQNTEVQAKKRYIVLLLEAKESMNNANFEKARQLYEQAFQVLNLGVAKKGILSSLEKIASMYFENNQFELSREYYELLLKEDVNNTLYQERYKISKNELLFEQLVEKGDSAYFTYQYPTALDNYQQALKIKRDNLVLKRKEECERFIERERKLREELEKQMTEKLADELKNKVEAQIKSKIEEELRAKKEEMLDKIQQEVRNEVEASFKQELEDSFWSRVTVWNTIEAYQFYKGFFPNGKHTEKASRRIEELKTRQQTKVEKPVVETESNTTSSVTQKTTEPKTEATTQSPTTNNTDNTEKKIENVQTEHKATRIRLSDVIHREDVKNAIPSFDKKISSENESKEEEILPTTDAILAKNKSEKEEVITKVETPRQEPPKPSKPDFSSMSDKELWAYAKNKGTIKAFMNYIENTKEYAYVADAYFEINQLKRKGFSLEDDREDEVVVESTTSTDIQGSTPTKSTTTTTAKPKNEYNFEAMSEDELWRYAEKENTVESYRNYVEFTKASLHVADAYYLINQLSKQTPAPKEEKIEVLFTKNEVSTPTPEEEAQINKPEVKASLEALENALKNFRQEDFMPKKKEVAPQKTETFGFSDAEIERIKRMSEEELWAWVQSKNTVNAYRAYVEFSQESSHVADAYYIINQLTHKDELEITPVSNSTSYNQPVFEHFQATSTPTYQNTYSSETSVEVTPAVELENTSSNNEEEIWEKAQAENTIGAYFNYLNTTIQKKYWDEAKKRINELKNNSQAQEQVDWEKAQKEDSVEAYKNYIRKYPLGNYYAKAMFRLNKLESEANS
ncbi:MAG: hypothetical protein OHK0038_07980 [Flammeovirgaceae bacterium]